jgi:hypothetical protein
MLNILLYILILLYVVDLIMNTMTILYLFHISYINERTNLLESFEILVFILPKTPIDIIIGRKTIKQQRLSITVPSHFEDQKHLIESIEMTTETLGDDNSQDMYGAAPLNQVDSKGLPFKVHAHVNTETHKFTSSLNLMTKLSISECLQGKRICKAE